MTNESISFWGLFGASAQVQLARPTTAAAILNKRNYIILEKISGFPLSKDDHNL